MSIVAMAFPILPGQADHFKRFIGELKGPRSADFKASRKKLGVHERTFLQKTPKGDMVVVTLEGADPASTFVRFGQNTDEFSKWFMKEVKEIHGFDPTAPPSGPAPELLLDTGT